MAIFRCNKCAHLREVPSEHVGKAVKCPRCQQAVTIYDTVLFVEKLLEKYLMQAKALRELQQQLQPQQPESSSAPEKTSLEEIDIYHTEALKSDEQYRPVLQWFEQRQIAVEVNHKAIDTTGFFDEIALAFGADYDTLREVVDQIKFVQRKGYGEVKLNLGRKSQEQVKKITEFCRNLYDYTFVAKYFYQKEDKIVRLKLQTIPAIINFFNGEWMEWLVFMRLLEFFRDKKLPVSCLRNLSITFPNKDVHELDIFFLIKDSVPVCIECKSGEFQQQIDKYLTLRKRMGIDKAGFLICIIGLSQKQCEGLTGMHELTFVNESNFLEHIEKMLAG
uniref:hypothetical protein n=1 Tax=Candidatus Electronema sp. TaxID=2698783 RepID=UPI0040568F34